MYMYWYLCETGLSVPFTHRHPPHRVFHQSFFYRIETPDQGWQFNESLVPVFPILDSAHVRSIRKINVQLKN